MKKLKWEEFIQWSTAARSVNLPFFWMMACEGGGAGQPDWGLPWKLAQSPVGKLRLSGSLPHTHTLKIFLRLSFGPQSLRPGSSSCYLRVVSRAGRQHGQLYRWNQGSQGPGKFHVASAWWDKLWENTSPSHLSCFQYAEKLKYIYITLCTGNKHWEKSFKCDEKQGI